MNILAFDLATNMGVSLYHTKLKVLKYEAVCVERKRYGMQFDEYYGYLKTRISPTIDVVVYEDVKRHSSTAAAHMFGYYRGALQQICHELGVACIGIDVGTIKRIVAGKGNATKPEVAEAVFKWFEDNAVKHIPLVKENNSITDDVTDSMAVAITAHWCIEADGYLIDAADKKNKYFL